MKKFTLFSASLMPSMPFLLKPCVTARVILPVRFSCTGLRLRLSNRFGKKAGRIAAATLCKCTADGHLIPSTLCRVTFGGQSRARIPAGGELVSEPVKLRLQDGDHLAVSVFCPGLARTMTGLSAGVRTAFGDRTGCFIGDGPEKAARRERRLGQRPVSYVPYLQAVDAETEASPKVLSVLGDSLTQQCRFTEPLEERLAAALPEGFVLLNHGLEGNCFTQDASFPAFFGKAGAERVGWDCYADEGVTHLLFAEGVNDAARSVSTDRFMPKLAELLDGNLARGIETAAITPLPARLDKEGRGDAGEARRQQYLRSFRALPLLRKELTLFDAEELMKAPDAPGYREGFATADGIHLSEEGGRVLAEELAPAVAVWMKKN